MFISLSEADDINIFLNFANLIILSLFIIISLGERDAGRKNNRLQEEEEDVVAMETRRWCRSSGRDELTIVNLNFSFDLHVGTLILIHQDTLNLMLRIIEHILHFISQ